MSEPSLSRMSTHALIEEFVQLAKVVRHFWTVLPDIPERTPERLALKDRLRAIGSELSVRKPIDKLRPLFDHESDDVRGFAAGQFLDIDGDWALATVRALIEGLSTKDVMALCDRARRGPPPGPAVKDMSIAELIARFEDAGIREYATRFMGADDEPWDIALANQVIGELIGLWQELLARDALSALLPLIEHANVVVRRAAASYCLPIAPDRAVPVLESIVADGDMKDRFGADEALSRWRGKFGLSAPGAAV